MSKNIRADDYLSPTDLYILVALAFACYSARQSKAKVGNKLRVSTPLLCLTADFWGLVSVTM